MARMRVATAVVVTRGGGADVEVLVVRRSPALRFFGGYWAFPGGTIDAADHDGDEDDDEAHRRCAVRELVEEVGWPAGAEAAELRPGLLQRDSAPASRAFRALVDAEPSLLEGVAPLTRLTTPPFAPVRYRTRFCHVPAPDGFEPDVVEGELVDGAFRRPADLLAEWRDGKCLVAPPVVYLLTHLAELGLERFLAEIPAVCAELEAGKLHPIRNVPGIVMVPLATRTLPPATTTNTYLVGEDAFYVIDPAPTDPEEQQRLFALIDERVGAGDRPCAVLLTHHHPDHVGAAEATAKRYGIPVRAHPETLARLSLEGVETVETTGDAALALGVPPDGYERWSLLPFHTPGHAPGHLAFVESCYGAMIAGDLVSTVSTIVIDPPDGHLATYLKSLERMAAVAQEGCVLHPAHGPVATNGRAVLERYIEHRARREAMLVAALEEGLRDESALVRRVYADVDERMWPVAARSLRAGLEKLGEEGRAREVASGEWRLEATG